MNFETAAKTIEAISLELEEWAAEPANYNHAIAGDVDAIGWELLRNASDLRAIIYHFNHK